MFGGPQSSATPPPSGGRPQTGEVARIKGNLTYIIVTGESSDGLHVFYNGEEVMTGQLENVGVEIVAPGEGSQGSITGVLTRYESGGGAEGGGARATRSSPLFPGTVEITAKGRRVSITCAEEGSFEGLGLYFGTTDENGYLTGAGQTALGVQSLRIVITPGLVDAKLKWVEDGREDTILS